MELATDALHTGLSALREQVRRDSEAVSDNAGQERAANLAHLLTKIAVCSAELRKAEAAARKDELSVEELLERVRRMPASERRQFAASVAALEQDAKRSGLA